MTPAAGTCHSLFCEVIGRCAFRNGHLTASAERLLLAKAIVFAILSDHSCIERKVVC